MQDKQNLQTESQVEEIKILLKELKNEQKILSAMVQKNNAASMKRLMKLQEYNKIDDMNSQIVEERLNAIEECLCRIVTKLFYE